MSMFTISVSAQASMGVSLIPSFSTQQCEMTALQHLHGSLCYMAVALRHVAWSCACVAVCLLLHVSFACFVPQLRAIMMIFADSEHSVVHS